MCGKGIAPDPKGPGKTMNANEIKTAAEANNLKAEIKDGKVFVTGRHMVSFRYNIIEAGATYLGWVSGGYDLDAPYTISFAAE